MLDKGENVKKLHLPGACTAHVFKNKYSQISMSPIMVLSCVFATCYDNKLTANTYWLRWCIYLIGNSKVVEAPRRRIYGAVVVAYHQFANQTLKLEFNYKFHNKMMEGCRQDVT